MRLIVCGSRHWSHQRVLNDALTALAPERIAHGCCRTGADMMADGWALRHQVPVQRYRARWRRSNGTLNHNAGPARNLTMRDSFAPDLVVAFKDGFDWRVLTDPAGRGYGGSENMVWLAMRAGITTRVVGSDGTWTETIGTGESMPG